MNFLAPIFLWLLPLVSVPILIYLFNKNKYKSINFSSLFFLRFIETKAIKKINIINIILLIIRTIIILLIILMISNPIITYSNTSNKSIDSVVVIGIDNSFSMNNEIKEGELKPIIKKIVNSYNDNTLFIMKTIDNEIELFNGYKKDLTLNNFNIKTIYKRNEYLAIFNYLKKDVFSTYLNKYLFIISDFQLNKKFDDITSISNDWFVNFIKLDINEDNAGISNITTLSDFIIPNEVFELNVEISNNSKFEQKDREIELFIDDINVGKLIANIPPKSKIIKTFKTSVPRRGEYKCHVSLSNDANIEDNYFYFLLDLNDNLNIQIIDNTQNMYLAESINSLNINNSFFKVTNHLNEETFVQNANFADILFVVGLSSISKSTFEYIKSSNKKSRIIIFPNEMDSTFHSLSNILNTNLTNKTNKINFSTNTYQEIDANNYSDYSKIFINNDNSSIKINSYIPLISNDNTLIKLSNSDFLLNKYKYDNSEIFLFSISLDPSSSDLPIKGAFIPLVNQLITNNKILSYKICGDKEYFENLNLETIITTPSNKKYQINNVSNQKIVFTYDEIGIYNILNESNKIHIASNIHFDEHNLTTVDSKMLSEINNKITLINNPENINNIISKQINGLNIWRYLLIMIILLVLIEMYLSNFYIKNE